MSMTSYHRLKITNGSFILAPLVEKTQFGKALVSSINLMNQEDLGEMKFDSPYIVKIKTNTSNFKNITPEEVEQFKGDFSSVGEEGFIYNDPTLGPTLVDFDPYNNVVPLEVCFSSPESLNNKVTPQWKKVSQDFIKRYFAIFQAIGLNTQAPVLENIRNWKNFIEFNLEDSDLGTLSTLFENAPRIVLLNMLNDIDDYVLEDSQRSLVKKTLEMYT